MVGRTTLAVTKGLLTRHCHKLQETVKKCETLLKQNSENDDKDFLQIHVTEAELQATIDLALNSLSKFAEVVDELDTITEEQEKEVQEYLDRAQTTIDHAESLKIELGSLRINCERTDTRSFQETSPRNSTKIEVSQPALPAIPIPTFTGDIWDFENFWRLFQANVDNQSLTKLQKFNYLINAPKGEARELLRRFIVTEDNYDSAIAMLHRKYGEKSRLISKLQQRLEKTRAENSTLESQRRLLEEIIPLVSQLEAHGVHLAGSYASRKLLSKFSPELKRKVLQQHLTPGLQEEEWRMTDTISALDECISMEERINEMIGLNEVERTVSQVRKDMVAPTGYPNDDTRACMFCESTNHKTAMCTKFSSIQDRRRLFQESERCLNCGKPGHFVRDCKSAGCRTCLGQKHHHTLCPKRHETQGRLTNRNPTQTTANPQPSPPRKTKEYTPRESKARTHVVKAEDTRISTGETATEVDSRTVLHSQETEQKKVEKVLLLTGVAKIWNNNEKKWIEAKILFDTGADQSFIGTDLAQRIGADCTQTQRLQMYTFGAKEPKVVECGVTHVKISDLQEKEHTLQLFATPIVTGKGRRTSLCAQDQAFIREHGITLSGQKQIGDLDPEILLGCDQLWNFLESLSPRYKLPSGLLIIPSKFGYLLTGKQHRLKDVPERTQGVSDTSTAGVQVFANFEPDFEEDRDRWDKYWTMDSAGICEFTGTKDAENEAANARVAKFFEDTLERREGVYYVRLPFKENHPYLPDNRAIAKKRLVSILHRLKMDPNLLQAYDRTMQDQLEKGIIEEIPDGQPVLGEHVHYIPHQPVITPHKETTKLRIVFDASSHFKDCPSLNDVLHQGPLILPELYAMLLRFRLTPYVATSDVEKAFLQVRLHECDRDATRFLWIRDVNLATEEDNIITYRFTRVTFGLNVSPFLLAGTIRYHLKHHVRDQEVAEEIRENLYVDNLILAAQTEEDLTIKAIEAKAIFTEMGMNLREFLSNTDSLEKILPAEACAHNKSQKILGLQWDAERDILTVRCNIPNEKILTKRLVAHHIASVYDPLGLLVPLMIKLKKFQQELWKRGLQWDEEIQGTLKEKWNLLRKESDGFERLLTRMAINSREGCRLAVFADASDMAMAVCSYLFNEKSASLVMAKSKLPSIKTHTTIPKLELNAITIATRLAFSVCTAIKAKNNSPKKIHIFSDSQIALSWISSRSQRTNPGVLVTNRIKEIYEIVDHLKKHRIPVQFHYVASEINPADVGTRGIKAEEFVDHHWWTGPSFLRSPEEQWPAPQYKVREGMLDNGDSITALMVKKAMPYQEEKFDEPLLDLTRFSSFTSARRAVAVMLIFIRRSIHGLNEDRQAGILVKKKGQLRNVQNCPIPILGETMRAARIIIIQDHQRRHLSTEYKKSMDNTLRLFQDSHSIWRSRGRLGKSSLTFHTQNPILVAPKTPLASLIIKEAHGIHHKGVEHTMMTVRTHYWIPQLRQQVRHLVQKCVNCRRYNALPYCYPDTSDLPQRRVQRSRPFQNIGLDFFDLPTIYEGSDEFKQYGCIFTCAVTRMIHLELVISMSTEDFLNALRRFIARRGVPESITCDNAPTFLLSAAILEEGRQDSYMTANITYATSNLEIRWHHITPYAPWQGAFYERLIKSIKQALHKTIRERAVRSRDHLHTILTEVEACLNSRPLTYQGSSREELAALRPIDFYQKDLEVTFPLGGKPKAEEEDTTYLPHEELRSLRTRREAEEAIQSSCRITEQFWKVWHQQYLTSLREKQLKNISRKRLGQEIPTVGSVVLISDPILPRNSWKLGRITEIRRGSDGAIREVELLISNRRKIRRPVNLLIPLEIDDEATLRAVEDISSTQNELEKEQRSKPYDLRPRQQGCNVKNVVMTSRKRNLRNSRTKWFLFYIMVLTFTTLV